MQPLDKFERRMCSLVLVHLLQDVLVKTLDPEERTFHAAALPFTEVSTAADRPATAPASELRGAPTTRLPHRHARNVAKIFVKQQNKPNAVLARKSAARDPTTQVKFPLASAQRWWSDRRCNENCNRAKKTKCPAAATSLQAVESA